MINENFIFLGVAIGSIGGIIYLIETLKGKVQPNKVTWFLWALAPLTAFAAQIQQGVGIESLMTFQVGFIPLLIFFASFFNKKSTWKLSKFDLICGGLSLVGLLLWGVTRNANVAILFAILSDLFAAIPTLKKSYFEPESENALAYFTALINSGITMLTIKHWTFAIAAFPIYIFMICLLLSSLIYFKLGKKFARA